MCAMSMLSNVDVLGPKEIFNRAENLKIAQLRMINGSAVCAHPWSRRNVQSHFRVLLSKSELVTQLVGWYNYIPLSAYCRHNFAQNATESPYLLKNRSSAVNICITF